MLKKCICLIWKSCFSRKNVFCVVDFGSVFLSQIQNIQKAIMIDLKVWINFKHSDNCTKSKLQCHYFLTNSVFVVRRIRIILSIPNFKILSFFWKDYVIDDDDAIVYILVTCFHKIQNLSLAFDPFVNTCTLSRFSP